VIKGGINSSPQKKDGFITQITNAPPRRIKGSRKREGKMMNQNGEVGDVTKEGRAPTILNIKKVSRGGSEDFRAERIKKGQGPVNKKESRSTAAAL